jgi:GAF domain-containing protein
MFSPYKENSPEANLGLMIQSVRAVLEEETDLIAGLANAAAALNFYLDDVNWVGFYILKGKELVLGPFQGLPACARIGEGKGVCGRAVLDAAPLAVPDVRLFPGHIACDSASASEMAVPLFKGGQVFGVLDIDSPQKDRFAGPEAAALIKAGAVVSEFLDTGPVSKRVFTEPQSL